MKIKVQKIELLFLLSYIGIKTPIIKNVYIHKKSNLLPDCQKD